MNKRWRGLLACVMVLALPATSFAAGAGGAVYQLRPPMTLTASAVDSLTEPIQFNGAKAVYFYLRCAAADADSLSAVDILVSNNGVTYAPINTLWGVGARVPASATSAGLGPLKKSGKFIVLVPGPGQSALGASTYIPWSWAKLAMSSVAQVDSLSVDAWWWDDPGTPGDRRGLQPTVR